MAFDLHFRPTNALLGDVNPEERTYLDQARGLWGWNLAASDKPGVFSDVRSSEKS